MRVQNLLASLGMVWITVIVSMIAGWITNIIMIYQTSDLPLTGKFILRIIGVFVVPVGSIIGILDWF